LNISRTSSICAAFDILPVLAAYPQTGPLQENAEFGRKLRDGRAAMDAEWRLQRRPNMAQGTVKFFNTQKGYGFIQPTDGGKDVFVHISAVERAGMSDLHEGQKVSYDVVSERGKLAAANLQSL
jgi:CspA family cold shock protein